MTKASDDYSNPQQGTTSQPPVTQSQEIEAGLSKQFKIAPTKRDSRKLFVGGLPPEGKSDPSTLFATLPYLEFFKLYFGGHCKIETFSVFISIKMKNQQPIILFQF